MKELPDRIAYGRAIRDEADRLVSDHGIKAPVQARHEADSGDISADERAFRDAVTARVARLLAADPDRKAS